MLYCDFSGYINLILAIGLCMGMELPKNFNKPFAAVDLREFWRKWHMSLTLFFRDYIYIPLGGNEQGLLKTQVNVLIVFILSGLWHGNTINFFLWGLLHGIGLIFLNFYRNVNILRIDFIKRIITFSYVSFLWLFFVMDYPSSMEYIHAIINNSFNIINYDLLLFVPVLLFLYIYPKVDITNFLKEIYSHMPTALLIVFLCEILFLVYLLMPNGIPNFIYQEF